MGLDFNTGNPVPLFDGQVHTSEGSSSIADAQGNLLFYTDGVTVWNNTHQVMQNGTGLSGHTSSSQSALIIKKPQAAGMYYIFTVGAVENPTGLQYSEVDMAANPGLGAVTGVKNIQLATGTTEGLTATLHSNGIDIWVVVHEYPGNGVYSYLIDAQGVNPEPVVSQTGPAFEPDNDWPYMYDETGCMKISPNGSRLCIASEGFGTILFDYNNQTGQVANPLILEETVGLYGPYGVEFSPSSKVLYVSGKGLFQYNLLAEDIPASKVVVADDDFMAWTASLQLASDGKIYKTEGFTPYLTVINNPNVTGPGCNAVIAGTYAGPFVSLGLPNAITSYFMEPNFNADVICRDVFFTTDWNQEPDSVLWDFGDGSSSTDLNPVHEYAAAGTYQVSITVVKSGTSYQAIKEVTVQAPPQFSVPQSLTVCNPEMAVITVVPQNFDISEAVYSWQFNGQLLDDNTPQLQPAAFGTYIVSVTFKGCTVTAGTIVSPPDLPAFQITDFCDQDIYHLKVVWPQSPNNAALYSWNGPEGFISDAVQIIVAAPGDYSVAIIDNNHNCLGSAIYTVATASCFIQKGISPNNDGKNDFFDLRGYNATYLKVFNRYGTEVYSLANYSDQWHGQGNKDEELPSGVYYYVISTAKDKAGTGWIYINREP